MTNRLASITKLQPHVEAVRPEVAALDPEGRPGRAAGTAEVAEIGRHLVWVDRPVDLVPGAGQAAEVQEAVAGAGQEVRRQPDAHAHRRLRGHGELVVVVVADVRPDRINAPGDGDE